MTFAKEPDYTPAELAALRTAYRAGHGDHHAAWATLTASGWVRSWSGTKQRARLMQLTVKTAMVTRMDARLADPPKLQDEVRPCKCGCAAGEIDLDDIYHCFGCGGLQYLKPRMRARQKVGGRR